MKLQMPRVKLRLLVWAMLAIAIALVGFRSIRRWQIERERRRISEALVEAERAFMRHPVDKTPMLLKMEDAGPGFCIREEGGILRCF